MIYIKFKKTFIILVIILFNIQLYAVKVEHEKAKQVAINFFEHIVKLKENQRPVIFADIIENNFQNTLCYYTVCFENGGYVNIAATDASIPVLSYSLSGSILPIENSPPAYIEWMESYKRDIYSIIANNVDNSFTIEKWERILNKDFSKTNRSVEPLTTSEWGQSRTNDFDCPGYNFYMPDNSECSCQKCPAGCVAIAMSQIMYYWKHPINYWFYTYYDWCNMNDVLIQYENENFENELAAISKLVYDCAESVDMNYCSDDLCQSSASTKDAVEAFELIFGYHQDADYKRKWWYSNNTWKEFIKNDLDNGQPIMYRGQEDGGHAFICDGYEETDDDYFHFNWGWYGAYYNEWYTIDDLTPGNYNFSNKQAAIFHIKPDPDYQIDYCLIGMELYNLYLDYYSLGGSSNPWEIVPETMQFLWSCDNSCPFEQWRTIPSGVTAEYIAHQSVFLQPGFHAQAGSHFISRITPCPSCETRDSKSNYDSIKLLSYNELSSLTNAKLSKSTNGIFIGNRIFHLYPNPNYGIFNIEFIEKDLSEFSLEVLNTMGNTVYYEQKILKNKIQINLKSQLKGIYFIKVKVNGNIFTKKMVYL